MKHLWSISIKSLICTGLFATVAAGSVELYTPIIDIDTAVVAGSGCAPQQDMYLQSTIDMRGNQVLDIDFYNLDATVFSPVLAARASCVIRAKMQIPAGKKLKILSAIANGSIDTDRGTLAASFLRISALGNLVLNAQNSYSTAMHRDFILGQSLKGTDGESACRRESQSGIFAVDLANSIQMPRKSNDSGSISLSDLKITYRLVPCHE
jgi:hypothetical protein